MARPSDVAAELRRVLEPVVTDAGLYLEDVSVSAAGRRSVVRVVVDLADGPGGVGSDLLTDVSRQVSTTLDDVDVVPGTYTLEVSTPGVTRPLTTARHYRRAEGRLVRLRTTSGALRGRVLAVDGEDVVIDTEGTRQVVALPDITSGTVEPELGRAADAAAEG
ncbi:ribosome maturation factor RimP [Georgenia satyanarayanai]|uniref:Ribosome maturation factor RimP n=1 Tax=Georgenia satyanarayanai TaxID=860221 RepID=A0A2Y9C5U1_9MICO|nr:ribosome maturation factor RimP [Georgenia satyanarayanai]PYF99893.1 ribosome maturation factor RimP [Georgenia satyanarayanai]SSA41893.1 ribosome maturation factor RimP [Georgenia satyanarayanai]